MEQKNDYAKMSVDLEVLKSMDIKSLVDFLAVKNKTMNQVKKETDVIKAEVQARGIQILEDKNIKFTEFNGNEHATASVTSAYSLSILNYINLRNLLGEIVEDKVKRVQKTDFDIDKTFNKALTILFTGCYNREYTVEQILDSASFELTDKQKTLLLKKLKGTYAQDKAAILAVLGKEDGDLDIDEELYYIYQIKNWELLQAFIPEDKTLEELEQAIKKCIVVEESVKIGVKSV